ncbi:hypothetical protein AAGV33_06610 [Flavobacterium sp. FBOR7N2.3]|uniref:Uncharacterized protein n=1 Tax=Flavobacterium magnesitis TaxID=3138077 RepID=A0ABV4TJM8_9FLAO
METDANKNRSLDNQKSIINEGQASSDKNHKQSEVNTASQPAEEHLITKTDKFYATDSNKGGLSSEKINQTLEDPFQSKNNPDEQKRPLID